MSTQPIPIPSDATIGSVPIPSDAMVSPDTQESTQGTSEPQQSAGSELLDMGKLGISLVYAHLLEMHPKIAHANHDDITDKLSKIAPDFAKRIGKAATVKDDPLYMMMRHTGPEPFESHDMLENFVHDVSEFAGDPVLWGPALIGALAGGPTGARIGSSAGFAIDSGLRKALMDHYQKGSAVSFGDLAGRTAATLWASAKGLATGEAMQLAGGIPVPKAIGETAGHVLRGLYQSAAMTTVASVLDGQVPKLNDFERSAVMVTGLGLMTHAATAVMPRQGLMDVYAKDGTTPEQSETKLQAQPPVKQAPPEGLKPAIRITAKDGSTQVITGDDGETHAELAERVTGEKPISMDELDADPKQSDKVLSQPEIQTQDVIDRAYALKDEAGDELPNSKPQSGRGFASLDSSYMSRLQARNWMKSNEPQVHDMWSQIAGDDKAEFHSQDYKQARERVTNRTLLEGDPALSGVSGELQSFLAKNRSEFNEVKAGNRSETYGNNVIRSTYIGPENMVRAAGEQVAGQVNKLLPDVVEREALSFMRDYRDDPDALRAMIEKIRSGDNEQLKRAIPSMERALDPTPKMVEADQRMTEYFKQANDLRTQFVGTGSSIDPERYSPRNFMRAEEEGAQSKGGGSPKFSKRSPHDIQREYLHLLDPLESGDVKAKTFDAVDQLRVYGDRLAKSVATSVFQMELKNTELGKWGAAGQIPSELKPYRDNLTSKELEEMGAIPSSWKELPGTHRTVVADGKVIQRGLMVPPQVADAMEPILQKDVLSGAQYWKTAKLAQAYIKSVELGLSPFHMRAMDISYMNNNGLAAYRDALFSDNNSPEFEAQERKGALYGLTTTKTGTPIDAYQGLKPSSMESRDTLLRKPIEYVDKAFKGITKATFEVAQRKFKVLDFSQKEAKWLAKHPNATDAEYGAAMRSISKEINAVYGGLNWEVMGVSKNFQAVARMFLLAPDWTFSNVANLKYALDPSENAAGGNAARSFWLKSFVTGYALSQGMSLMLTGHTSKQWDKVYMGKDDKGKEMYSSIFFAGAPKDAIGLANSVIRDGFPTGALKFAANKASPLVGTGVRMVENKDWQGNPITKPKDSGLTKTGKEIGFAAEQLSPAPFAIKDMAVRYMDPNEDLTYKDFIAALVGAPVYHEKPKQAKGTKKRGYHLAGSR